MASVLTLGACGGPVNQSADAAPVATPTAGGTGTGTGAAVPGDAGTASGLTPATASTGAPTGAPGRSARSGRTLPVSAGQVLVAGPRGVTMLATRGTGGTVVAEAAARAFDDGRGGVVYQSATPPGAGAIVWLPAADGEPVQVVPAQLADRVVLEGAAVVDGNPTVIFSVEVTGDQPADYQQSLQSVRLPDGERQRVDVVGGFESGLSAATLASTGTVSVQTYAEVTTDFRFVNLAGEAVSVPGNPLGAGACGDEPGCPTGLTLDLTGQRLAWLQPRPGDDAGTGYDLRVQGVQDDEPAEVVTIAASWMPEGVLPSTVELAGDLAVVNRGRTDGPDAPAVAGLLIDLTTATVTELPLAGEASLTRAG
ncbi:hypothetical protein [Pseudokineococcus marinus]|uniref:Uncharacterized protein n=1 Tax=Pseudokineococcus marinus TaxID=351215 RepID=A0A849BRM0_9ACTN|nr:hypothetical protein [Pseudokineococcus marinus]NNH22166.1 hypothetical protein [Pseudokineococcus marinus]